MIRRQNSRRATDGTAGRLVEEQDFRFVQLRHDREPLFSRRAVAAASRRNGSNSNCSMAHRRAGVFLTTRRSVGEEFQILDHDSWSYSENFWAT